MKYIKQYEDVKKENFKKIVVVEIGNDPTLFILEIHSYNEIFDTAIVSQHYHYINELEKDTGRDTCTRIDLTHFTSEFNVIYTSDDIQECIDYTVITKETNKYNL